MRVTTIVKCSIEGGFYMLYFDQVERLIQEEVQKNRIAGANVMFLKDNQEIYHKNIGWANIEKKMPIKSNTIFRLYSLSKPVAAVATMILYERGMLDLSANVREFLPGFQNQKVITEEGLVPLNRDVTLLDLLAMTSGLVYPDEDEAGKQMQALFSRVEDEMKQGKLTKTVALANEIGKRPLAFQPGETWRYGTSTDVMGAVIEVVSGKSLSEFYREEIFEPLGMLDTGFYVPEEKQDRFAELYDQTFVDGKSILEPAKDRHLCLTKCLIPPAFESAGAGLVSTITDYAKFANMLCFDGTYDGIRILGRKTVDFMTQNQLSEKALHDFSWDHLKGHGYGFFQRILISQTEAGTNASLGEFGWDGWSGPYVTIDRAERFVMLYMIQICGYSNWCLLRKIRAVANSAL